MAVCFISAFYARAFVGLSKYGGVTQVTGFHLETMISLDPRLVDLDTLLFHTSVQIAKCPSSLLMPPLGFKSYYETFSIITFGPCGWSCSAWKLYFLKAFLSQLILQKATSRYKYICYPDYCIKKYYKCGIK